MLSSGTNVIMWDQVVSGETIVIMWDKSDHLGKMLSCGNNQQTHIISCETNVIMWE